ncbi:MAG: hypothetical protein IT378_05765 [Sandaracinaceae bacterium]|nr:hypothetical protein [Sandaracinaceae bacterium]
MAHELSVAVLAGLGVGAGFVATVMLAAGWALGARMRPRGWAPILGRALLGASAIALVCVAIVTLGVALDGVVRAAMPRFGNVVLFGTLALGCSLGARDLGLSAALLVELHRVRDSFVAIVIALVVLGLAMGVRVFGQVVFVLGAMTALL